MGVFNGELIACGVPGGSEDEFFKRRKVLNLSLSLFGGVSMEDVVLRLVLVFYVLFQRDLP